jgi:predicted dinucleotide-binding enzyme
MAFMAGHSGVAIARRLNISGAGVTVASKRGKKLINKYPELTATTN